MSHCELFFSSFFCYFHHRINSRFLFVPLRPTHAVRFRASNNKCAFHPSTIVYKLIFTRRIVFFLFEFIHKHTGRNFGESENEFKKKIRNGKELANVILLSRFTFLVFFLFLSRIQCLNTHSHA